MLAPAAERGVGLRKVHREVMKSPRDTLRHRIKGKALPLVVIFALGVLSVPPATGAPQPGKIYKIGVLHQGAVPRSVSLPCGRPGTSRAKTLSSNPGMHRDVWNAYLHSPGSWSA